MAQPAKLLPMSPCGGVVVPAPHPLPSNVLHTSRHQLPAPTRRRGAAGRRGQPAPAGASSGGGGPQREVLQKWERGKLDSADDRDWYAQPRIVHHVDEGFRQQVTELYRQRIPEGAAVLDLMSSWVSHLPKERRYSRVLGMGLNAAELGKNPQLTEFVVRNLNQGPDGWEAADKSFDAVVCCVSVQYLQQPERVFAEIYRVLKPGGVCIITFSNRLFYSKAIAAWRDGSGYSRAQLVKSYFAAVEGFTQPEALTKVEAAGDSPPPSPLERLRQLFMQRAMSDPFYGVLAYRNFRPMTD